MSAAVPESRHNPAIEADGSTRSSPNAGHIEALNALRGIAILLVITGHYVPFNLVGGEVALAVSSFAQGGVTLFFALSGFLIERNLTRNANLARYALHRIFRIVPAYWAALLVILVFEWRLSIGPPHSAREILINAAFLSDILGAALISGVFWTLLIEVKFYVAAPLLKFCGDRLIFLSPLLAIVLNCSILAFRGTASHLLTYITFCLVGMQFSLQCRGAISRLQLSLVVAAVVAATFFFVPYYKTGVTLFALLGFVLLWCAIKNIASALFRIPGLRFAGIVSYSWYLYHAAFGYPVIAAFGGANGGFQAVFAVGAGLFTTLAMAWLSNQLIEQPGIDLGRKLERRATGLI